MKDVTSTDALVLKALKGSVRAAKSPQDRDKAQRFTDAAKSALADEATRVALGRLADFFVTKPRRTDIGQPLPPPLAEIEYLMRAGASRSAEFAWLQLEDSLNKIDWEYLVRNAPTVAILEHASRRHRDLKESAITWIKENRESVHRSAALDWVVAKAKPKELIELKSILIADMEREPHLLPLHDLLSRALKRDISGNLLRVLLDESVERPLAASRLSRTISDDPKLATQFIRLLPKLLASKGATIAVQILEQWTASYPKTPERQRESLASALAGLVAQLLKRRKRSPGEEQVLSIVDRAVPSWLLTMEEKDARGFWICAAAADLLSLSRPRENVSVHGATLIANSLEKARAGASSEALLEALALNLGMDPICSPNDRVKFDAALHEDVKGGLLAGDDAQVHEKGWRIGRRVIRRAKVIPVCE